MNTNAKAINENSVSADPSRAFHGVAPFRVIAGRGIVDARGRLVATCKARALLDAKGYVVDSHDGFSNVQGDDNTHGIAHALNIAAMVPALVDGKPEALPERWRVTWEIDSDAATPEDAAREAVNTFRESDSWANVFDVRDASGATVRVDLQAGTTQPLAAPADAVSLDDVRAAVRDAVDTIEARGSISDDALAMLARWSGAASPYLHASPRDPNASPRVGDELPLNAPRLCDPEPRGDGTQCRLYIVQGNDMAELTRDVRGLVADIMHAKPADITGALVRIEDGGLAELWLTESARPFDLRTARYTCVVAPEDGE
jgi:hypothetical protein